jgi:integrase
LRAFLAATRDDRLAPLWRLLAMTGMRRGEALGLKWSDVDFAGGRVSIQRSRVLAGGAVLEHPPKTRAGRRAVPLDAATLAKLKAWKTQQSAERLAWGPAWVGAGWIFTRDDGQPLHPGLVTKRFGEAVAVARVPRIRLHDLRHTSATLALAAGVHAKVVQERLGHATISQTLDTYSHTTPSLHEGAAAQLAAIVDGDA